MRILGLGSPSYAYAWVFMLVQKKNEVEAYGSPARVASPVAQPSHSGLGFPFCPITRKNEKKD